MSKKSQKWHIRYDGKIGKCNAESGRCPFGGLSEHFTDKETAQEYADLTNEIYESTNNTIFENAYVLNNKESLANQNIKNDNIVLRNGLEYIMFTNKERTKGKLMDVMKNYEIAEVDVPKGLYDKLRKKHSMMEQAEKAMLPDDNKIKEIFNDVIDGDKPQYTNYAGAKFYKIKDVHYDDKDAKELFEMYNDGFNVSNTDDKVLTTYFNKNYKGKTGKSFAQYRKELKEAGYDVEFYNNNKKYGSEFGIVIKKR